MMALTDLLPDSDPALPFFEAAACGVLLMPQCTYCDELFFYPRARCPRCLANGVEWCWITGEGQVVARIDRSPADAPTMVVVSLMEGLQVTGQLVDDDATRAHVGSSVSWRHTHDCLVANPLIFALRADS